MYTCCPDCNRQYRILAEQLSAAQGTVICGFCGRQFNALLRLYDIPQKIPVQLPDINLRDNIVTSPIVIPALKRDDREEADIKPVTVEKVEHETRFDLSESLQVDETEGKGGIGAVIWSAGALLLLTLFTAQLFWFNRDHILQWYPGLIPWVERFCEHYQCSLIRERDPSAIKILNRDVRLHPDYANTLLVNATVSNQSWQIQPFPKIQLALFDPGGRIFAYRIFTPEEYLDDSITIMQGMTPRQPVHFVLEVTGPTQDAVSFEFRFL
jgi:Protein of unknown function (DUF3426).